MPIISIVAPILVVNTEESAAPVNRVSDAVVGTFIDEVRIRSTSHVVLQPKQISIYDLLQQSSSYQKA